MVGEFKMTFAKFSVNVQDADEMMGLEVAKADTLEAAKKAFAEQLPIMRKEGWKGGSLELWQLVDETNGGYRTISRVRI